MARTGELPRPRGYTKEAWDSLGTRLSYVRHFRDRGEALVPSSKFLPEFPKSIINGPEVDNGISTSIMVTRKGAPSAKKFGISIK